jgi:hypothetical protein
MRKGTVRVNVSLLKEIIRFDNLTDEEIRELAGWGTPINLRRAREGRPILKRIFGELAGALSVKPISLLFAGSGASYSDVLRGRGEVQPPPGPPPPGPTGSSVHEPLRELHALDDDGRVGELTKRCYYKIENATLTIRGTKADLIISVTMFNDRSCSKKSKLSSHCLKGDGRFVDGSASILYTVEDQPGQLSWAGVCVLNVPPAGKIRGYWMAAGQTEWGRTVLGRLELDRKSLVRKSSEEAGGHDQREG